MFGYIIGSVKYLTSNHIILENNGIGYIIFVANPYAYEIGKEYTVYTYQRKMKIHCMVLKVWMKRNYF